MVAPAVPSAIATVAVAWRIVSRLARSAPQCPITGASGTEFAAFSDSLRGFTCNDRFCRKTCRSDAECMTMSASERGDQLLHTFKHSNVLRGFTGGQVASQRGV